MKQQKQGAGARVSQAEQAVRDQEVLRATRELAAYFKGTRTEREARAALKIIKTFVRERERQDPKNRPALPGVNRPSVSVARRRPARPKRRSRVVKAQAQSSEPAATAESSSAPESAE